MGKNVFKLVKNTLANKVITLKPQNSKMYEKKKEKGHENVSSRFRFLKKATQNSLVLSMLSDYITTLMKALQNTVDHEIGGNSHTKFRRPRKRTVTC